MRGASGAVLRWLGAWRLALAFTALGVLFGTAGCGASVVRPEPARLRVISVPERASVYVDDRFAGTGRVLAQRPVAFTPGVRYVTVQADGFFPHDVAVTLPSGLTTLRIALRPIPP
jgi:hypothetical protein